ncbi:MAG: radical SAM protein [Polyangiaceae bacterium]|nr:radical SAM protein [Polyangiaceae bacterium]
MTRPKRHALAIELTAYCNQKCGYCYNDFRENPAEIGSLSKQDLLRLVDRALTEVEFDHVTLTGGEPFARPEIFDILEIIARHKSRAIIISNGGIITAEHAQRLATLPVVFVQITLNGPSAPLHEEHVGQGCFEPTLRGIRTLLEHNVGVSGSIVVTRKNARSVADILTVFRELGVVDIALSRFSPAGYATSHIAELLPSRSDLVAALTLAEPFGKNGMHIQVTLPVPPCVIDTHDYPHITFSSCPIGTEAQEFALGPRGELRHCTLHTDVIGNPQTTSFAQLVTSPQVAHYRDVTPEFCAPCPMKASCIGGCGASAQAVFGTREVDPIVAQHVNDSFASALSNARKGMEAFIPANQLVRRTFNQSRA